MTDRSPILTLPYLQPSQAQKHVTHNEALRQLDAIVQLAVLSADQTTPPATVVDGDRYLVAANAQAAWAGHDHEIAVFVDAGWQFTPAMAGWVAQVLDANADVVFDGQAWVARSLDNLPGLGIGASHDGYNRLVVSSDAVLLNNAGAGHQVKVNKAAAGDTASLLFQTGYGGRAELGTAGSDDFSLKVSADGNTWTEALHVDAATGRMTAGIAGWREMLAAPRVYYVDQALGDDTGDGMAVGTGAFATIARAIQAAEMLDSGGHDVTVQLANGTYTLAQALMVEHGLVGGGRLIIQGQVTDPDLVTLDAVERVLAVRCGTVVLRGIRLQNASAGAAAVTVTDQGALAIDQVVFGPAGGHVSSEGGLVRIEGDYAIEDGAAYHLQLTAGARLQGGAHTVTLNGTPTFSDAFLICAETSVASFGGHNFAGGAMGKAYDVSSNAVVQSGGVLLPGDQAGTTQTGGLFL